MASAPANGQTGQPVPGYVMKRWTTAEGLPHNSIVEVVQTRDGYLWIATGRAGLVRFDGLAFTTFNALNTPSLESNTIGALHEDADGTLWIASGPALIRYRDGAFAQEPFDDETAPGAIADIRSDRDGNLWVAGHDRVIRREDNRWTVIVTATTAFQPLSPASDGTMWIGTSKGLIEWRGRVIRTLTIDEGLPSDLVHTVHQDRSGRVWIGTDRGLAQFDPRDPNTRVEGSPSARSAISTLFEDRDGALWIGGSHGLLVRNVSGAFNGPFARGADDDSSAVIDVTEDREGNIWFGIAGGVGGLYRLTRQRVTTFTHQYGLPCDNVGPITESPDGTIWLASLCGGGRGVVAIRDGRPVSYDRPTYVASLLAEADGTVWVGTFDGALFRLTHGRFVEVPVPTRDAEDDIAAMYRHADGALWLGTSSGLLKQENDGRWSRLRASDGLVGDDVRVLVGDRHGALWVGTASGLSQYHAGRFTNYSRAEGLPSGPVRAIYVDADEVVWIGTYGGGLARLANGTITAFGDPGGLLDASVHRILEDDQGFLWLTGDRGIRRVSKRDLNAIADGRAVSLDVTLYDEADGMLNAECNGMGQPAGWRMRDGAFQFPTQRGVVRIDPSAVVRSTQPAPAPHFEQVIVNGRPASIGPEVTIAPGFQDIEVRYTAPALSRADQVRFRYRFDGRSEEWIELGTRRSASFFNLQPGRYRLLVAARHVGGTWSEPPAALVLVLQPFFYQRPGFQLALLAVALGVSAIGGRWYVKRLQRRADQLERAVAERTAQLSLAHERVTAANEGLVKAKHEVEQAHGQVLAVLNQLDIGVLVFDVDGIVHYASASAQRVLRKDEAALVGRSWSACLPLVDADRARLKTRIENRSATEGRVPVQMVIGGMRYWMELDVRNEPPPGVRRIVYMYDVTELSALPSAEETEGAHGLVGRSTAMHVVQKQIRDVARVDSTVLIEGETGVGKELVARAIHLESPRRARPFVAVNAAGLSESILASQLFGHRRGAFTGAVDDQIGLFEAANGGTLFLDEIGDMPLSMQASLLRVLQEREITRIGESQARRVDVRFLAATHRDLKREVEEGRFREDLLYRIRVARIQIPPLRERMDDVPLLVDAFLTRAARDARRPAPSISRDAIERLLRYDWPGNIRELRAAIDRALTNTQDDLIGIDELPTEIIGVPAPVASGPTALAPETERARLIDALRRAEGNRSRAARLLGIGRRSLYRKLAEHGLD